MLVEYKQIPVNSKIKPIISVSPKKSTNDTPRPKTALKTHYNANKAYNESWKNDGFERPNQMDGY